MPALKDVPSVLRVQLGYTVSTDTTNLTRLFFRYAGTPPTSSALNAWCTAVGTQWQTRCGELCTVDKTLTSVTATDLTTSSSGNGSAVMSHQGTRTGGSLAAGTCTLLNYVVARRYRGGKPRSYMPFGAVTDLSSGQQWAAPFLTLVNTNWAAFINAITVTTLPAGVTSLFQVNVSYYLGFTVHTTSTGRAQNIPTPRDVPVVDNITSFTVDPNVASQRRRQR